MRSFKFFVAAVVAVWCVSAGSGAQAATVLTCPNTPANPNDREFTLDINTELPPTDADVVSCFTGVQGDPETPGAGWTMIDKDESPDFAGSCESCLSITGLNATSGTWSISAAAWEGQTQLYIGFKTGVGTLDPDFFFFLLDGGALTGDWSVTGQQSLSHASLWSGPPTVIPEPTSLLLLGTGLFGAGAAARRRRQNKQ